ATCDQKATSTWWSTNNAAGVDANRQWRPEHGARVRIRNLSPILQAIENILQSISRLFGFIKHIRVDDRDCSRIVCAFGQFERIDLSATKRVTCWNRKDTNTLGLIIDILDHIGAFTGAINRNRLQESFVNCHVVDLPW